ncbi:conserved hypothetical protein [Pseudomonas sp. 8BK]|nr:conserved hypothetical protein [Pseudomonas sp. 8BK]
MKAMKTISVPLYIDALNRLDIDQSLPGDLKEIYLNDAEFEELFSSGVINEINHHLGKLIDDYEDESIQVLQDLKAMLGLLEAKISQNDLPVLQKIISLTKIAIVNKTGVFFYF